jgi:hypothetical protein
VLQSILTFSKPHAGELSVSLPGRFNPAGKNPLNMNEHESQSGRLGEKKICFARRESNQDRPCCSLVTMLIML